MGFPLRTHIGRTAREGDKLNTLGMNREGKGNSRPQLGRKTWPGTPREQVALYVNYVK